MKLLTEMCRDDNGEMYANDPDPYQAKGAVARDAACAHAYKRELANMRKAAEETPRNHERQLVLNLLDALDRRASEIMAGWGFDSGEAE